MNCWWVVTAVVRRRPGYNPSASEGELQMSWRITRALTVVAAATAMALYVGVSVRAQAPAPGGGPRWVKGAPFPEPEEELYAEYLENLQ